MIARILAVIPTLRRLFRLRTRDKHIDDEPLNVTIRAPRHNEVRDHAQLGNGDINVRDFVAGLAKSDAYKQSYFFKVSPIRGIELNLKHLLGRPPVNQAEVSRFISLIAEHGFDALVDQITRSGEYLEVFGTDTVPYSRAFKSEAGFYCSTFVNMGQVCPGNASSDSTTQSRSLLVKAFNDARSLSNGTGGFDVAAFSYSKAVTDPSSRAFQRMYQSKTAKTWG